MVVNHLALPNYSSYRHMWGYFELRTNTMGHIVYDPYYMAHITWTLLNDQYSMNPTFLCPFLLDFKRISEFSDTSELMKNSLLNQIFKLYHKIFMAHHICCNRAEREKN